MVNEDAPAGSATSPTASAAAGTGRADASSTISSTEDDFAAATEITINIKILGGNDFELEVAPDIAVSALKTRVRERTGVDEDRQRLIYRGRVLVDAEPLSTYKVETGHSLHMVARPLGFTPPPGNATAGTATGSSHDSTTQGNRASTLGQRLLMGMGVPMMAGGEQNRNGVDAGGIPRDPALMNAAGLDGGQFLTNMLGLAGAGGASAGAGGGSLGELLTSSPTQHPQALWNAIEGRAARVQSRQATAATGGGARGAVDTDEAEGGGGAVGEDGQTDLEHVRQGLLTLHTLLSTTRRRSRRGAGRARAAGEASGAAADTTTGGATVSSLSRSLSPSVGSRGRRWPRELAISNSPSSASSLDEISAARDGDSAAATTDQPESSSAGQSDKISRPASPTAVEDLLATSLGPHQAPAETPVDHKSALDGISPVLADGPALEPSRRVRGGNDIDAPLSPGSSTAWLPPSVATARPAADSSSGGQGNEKGDDSNRGADGVTGAARIEPRWPLASEGIVGRRSDVQRSVAGSEAGSDLCPGLSPEGPRRLLSSSGESTSDGWEDERHSRSLSTFLRVSQTDNSGDGEEEKKDQEDFQEESEAIGGTRKFFVGQWLDVKDTVHNWLEATVMDISDSGRRLQIHYNGWPPRWDEWLSWDSPRIAPFRTRTQHLPHSQHVSPAPISAVRNAPITGLDDVRVVMPEVSRVLQEIGPMVQELSACYARSLERDTSANPMGERAVSHTLPWPRQRVNDEVAASVAASDASPKIAELAGDVAPLLDRLGRMLTDVAPHLARLGNSNAEDGVEPGEVHGGSQGRRATGSTRSRARRSHARSRSPDRAPATAFRQLVSTSSPAPTSSNINIHIHAIVPLRAPPSPPPPPPPPPPTAAASAVATPTRAERPPLAVAGSRNSPWAAGLDAVGASASLLAAARAAEASRARGSRESETSGGGTPRSAGRGIVAGSPRSFGTRGSGDEGAAAASAGGSTTGGRVARSRSASVASSASLVAVIDTPRSAVASGSSASVHSELSGGMSSSSAGSTRSDSVTGPDQASSDLSTTGQSGGQRRTGGWRSLLRVMGVGGSGSNSRVGGRRDGGEGDSAP